MSAVSAPGFDSTEFRRALGSFATGVTVITTRAPDGTPLGMTVSSFNSVSLEPPLVLWSLANSSLSLPAFRAAEHWIVHVLGTDQESLSGRFARRGEDKFAGLDFDAGVGGAPLLRGCSARFQCRTAFQYEGGDHVIFVGEVLAFDREDHAPLVFHGGRYAHATRRDAPGSQPRSAHLEGSFGEDFLGYLLGRSHFQFFAQMRPLLAREGLSDEAFHVLSTLTLKPQLPQAELAAATAGIATDGGQAGLQALLASGLAQRDGSAGREPAYALTEAGKACALRLVAAAKDIERELLSRLGPGEAPVLKSLLNRLIGAIDPAAAQLWERGAA